MMRIPIKNFMEDIPKLYKSSYDHIYVCPGTEISSILSNMEIVFGRKKYVEGRISTFMTLPIKYYIFTNSKGKEISIMPDIDRFIKDGYNCPYIISIANTTFHNYLKSLGYE